MAKSKKANEDVKKEVVTETKIVETEVEENSTDAEIEIIDAIRAEDVEVNVDENSDVVEGNEHPVSGEKHDCIKQGLVKSISVGGRRMTLCKVCGNKF